MNRVLLASDYGRLHPENKPAEKIFIAAKNRDYVYTFFRTFIAKILFASLPVRFLT
jgi:hypothetical protein